MDVTKLAKTKLHAVQAAVSVVSKPVAEKVMAIKPVAAVTDRVVRWADANPGSVKALKAAALGVAVVAGLPAEAAIAIGTGGLAAPAVIAANFGVISTALGAQQLGSQMAVVSREHQHGAAQDLSTTPNKRADRVGLTGQSNEQGRDISQGAEPTLHSGTWYTLPKGGELDLRDGSTPSTLPVDTKVLPLGETRRGARASITDASEANVLTPGGSIERVGGGPEGISISAENAHAVSAPRLSAERAPVERDTSRTLSRSFDHGLGRGL